MSRKISRRDLFTKVVPASAALVVAPKVFSEGVALAFYHGVASGDPTQSEVIIWTRVTTSKRLVTVAWEFASDAEFAHLVASGEVETSAQRDYTVKIDVEALQANTNYYYRFSAMEVWSTVGQTRTLPRGSIDSFTMGVCSCANYPAGYFNAYRAMADDTDLDLVLHLGDYIYEYDAAGYASTDSLGLGRVSQPLNELTRLSDYRRRHGQYKSDPDLQKLHARLPFILSWDDHEFVNDAWVDGAQNHNQGEGDWEQRKAAGLQAYYEWMPIRAPRQRPLYEQWRSFEIGDLATLIILETRISARDEQVSLVEDMRFVTIKFDISDIDRPELAAADASGAHIEVLRQPFDLNGDEATAITDYQQIKKIAAADEMPAGIVYYPNIAEFTEHVLDHADRQILGQKQRDFVAAKLTESAANKPWQIIANQTILAKLDTPDLAAGLSESEMEKVPHWLKPLFFWSKFGVPFGTDSWNGYGAEREWLLGEAATSESSMIVLTGDTHSAWGIDLQPQIGGDWHAVELGVSAISSPGISEALGIEARHLSEMLVEANNNLYYSETGHRGYLSVELTPEKVNAKFHHISTVDDRVFESAGTDHFEVTKRNSGSGVELKKV